MEIKEFIEIGERKAGKQVELAKILGIRDTSLRLAKSGKKGLPDAVCIELADYIQEDPLMVIAASNLVTEKDERRRKVFEKCIKRTSQAACVGFVLISALNLMPAHNTMKYMDINSSGLQQYKLSVIEP